MRDITGSLGQQREHSSIHEDRWTTFEALGIGAGRMPLIFPALPLAPRLQRPLWEVQVRPWLCNILCLALQGNSLPPLLGTHYPLRLYQLWLLRNLSPSPSQGKPRVSCWGISRLPMSMAFSTTPSSPSPPLLT